MELIRKSDALHAVLHNTGDAAVAAVQEIEPVLIWTDADKFFREHGAKSVKLPEIKTQTLHEWREEQTDGEEKD